MLDPFIGGLNGDDFGEDCDYPSESYFVARDKKCKYCRSSIYWRGSEFRNSNDGKVHRCRQYKILKPMIDSSKTKDEFTKMFHSLPIGDQDLLLRENWIKSCVREK